MDATKKIVSRDPEVMSGELVFAGTRVEVKTLVDYLKAATPSTTSWRASRPFRATKPKPTWKPPWRPPRSSRRRTARQPAEQPELRVLLDENVDRRLKRDFAEGHDA